MELKITNKITNCITRRINREVSNLKIKWCGYVIKYYLWKIRFNINTLPMRIALNPKMIKLKVEGRLNQVKWKFNKMGWKIYRIKNKIKSKFRTWRHKEKVNMCADVLKATLLSLLVIYFMSFVFDVSLLAMAHYFGLMMDWKIV